jgi:alkyl hydroperoxide reductase subunit AhpC
MIISIERMAMKIAGKTVVEARKILSRFNFSAAESGEIVAAHWRKETASIDPDWAAVAVTIRSAIECSVRLGDRRSVTIG